MTKLVPHQGNTSIEKRRERRQRRLKEMVRSVHSENTNISYNGDLHRFSLWLIDNDEPPFVALNDNGSLMLDNPKEEVAIALYSVEPLLVGEYIVDLEAAGLKPSTIGRAMAAISSAHKKRGWVSPTKSPGVEAAMKHIRRTQGVKPKRKDPILLRDARKMVSTLPEDEMGLRDRALVCLGLAGGFRRSELASLKVYNVQLEVDEMFVEIERSKGDQEGAGYVKRIAALHGDPACPVMAVRLWLAVIHNDSGPLFRRIRRGGNITEDGLTGHGIALVLKKVADGAGVDPKNISGHSLRRGYGQTLDQKGLSLADIQQLMRHKDPKTTTPYLATSEVEKKGADAWASMAEPEGEK